ncbi:organic cation transporter protein-like [Maniola hyperantus]|uniref:organic cation transporter protein-like n=1 Tax=Aphantopus hyperantus TaxID=2795564 RepID=UPI001568B3E8|nr:organic cation transporter protein-like isoform X4 [Maniola hyperantus]
MPVKHNDSDGENTSDGKDQVEEKASSEFEKPTNCDDLVRRELGEFGWFQLRSVLIIIIPIIFSGIRNDYILSAAAIPHRCRIPECGENSSLLTYNPDWILNAVPETKSGFSSCDRYAPTDSAINGSLDYCPASLFNHTIVVSCKDFVYANDFSVVYDFDLGCNEWLRALAGTVGNIGLILGLPLTGYISDRFGRKVALVVNIVCLGLVGVIRAFSVNYAMYMILQLVQTVFGSSVYSTALVLATELVGPKYRFIGVTLLSMYSLGQVMMGGVYWLIGTWRYATLALCTPCLFMVVYYWLLSESIRWLLVKERYAEARKIIETAARLNKKSISDNSMEALLKPQQRPLPRLQVKKTGLIRTVIRSPILLTRVCTTPIWWIAGTFVYYGLSINSTGLSDTMYLNYMLTSAVEIPGCFAGAFLLTKIGRRATLSSGFFLSALCSILFIFIPNGMYVVRLLTYLLGKVGVTMALASLYLYTSELYPTEYRHTFLAFSSTVGRLGAIVAPLTPILEQYWTSLPSVMFGAMGLFAGALVLTQPETLGTKLPDTFSEAELLGKSVNRQNSEI